MLCKYLFDRVASFIGLILLFPVLVVVGILICVKMPGGPVIFRQKRVGQQGRLFTMYKFRSMTDDQGGSSVSEGCENRINPFGAKLRRYKLDELLQLWNVFIGDMSFVGPRPDVSGYADMLQGNDRRILLLKPGITGPASLKYRNEEELLEEQPDPKKYNDEVLFPDKVKINLDYLDNWSFGKDVKIIFYTILGKDWPV